MSPTSPVTFEEQQALNGYFIGVATLNSEKTLNALTLDMIDLLTHQLMQWSINDKLACVILQGTGDKAFCAGGDIIKLYESMKQSPNGPNPYAENFFTREYRLDYLIHTFSKPIICLGQGIVMGGGLGLFAGASHRVVTEHARIAMPEITIGLFPDVGGTWFLNKMPDNCGLYLGLTGASINATDALYLNLATHFIPSDNRSALLQQLKSADWSVATQSKDSVVDSILDKLADNTESIRPHAQVEAHQELINSVTSHSTLPDIVSAITDLKTDDKWLNRGISALRKGCPTTAKIVYHQITQGHRLSLKEVFKSELIIAIQCTRHPDFPEGVRALLIDKDNAPNWFFKDVDSVTEAWLNQHLTPPWPDNHHPLKNL
ncbi:enoyl-CoA hydratase/isomerase family protein [Alkalimarinus alittae]|uniref:3-hydroxyisobutyryl-CoA hydrolase n=1 Tax=Alkalimarinus alittae TaxID=2961619 RepID=A0ABY6N3H9_9ALTE|nr:enoyl-CoA hydratase/isomerase family protein [Alkalimarinus alittae]UZE96595.1 enoyl-CoA hydratase/isomerase family protein [Alkalimarinus alittae]